MNFKRTSYTCQRKNEVRETEMDEISLSLKAEDSMEKFSTTHAE